MAKINIKSEKNTPYIGIFYVGKVVFCYVNPVVYEVFCVCVTYFGFYIIRKFRLLFLNQSDYRHCLPTCHTEP